ncbi:ankyrin repeat-containing domain protein [Rhypophila decipiens]|uniref:Ankyrin repeat-containing domain protein n=1 Tax=Rhypophila decipiens TaxID=261697 RepID=A0AAN6Y850_9PEZI|nr:ankyrin repeat-containing domain protein [Rhypophila decipiens]
MDPISIVSLVGTCAALATRVVSTAAQIDEFLQSYGGADRSVASLSTTLWLFGESLTQMRSWLEKEPAVSQNLRRTIKGSVDHCETVLDDLEEHVGSVLRSAKARNGNSALGGLGFGRKLKHIWNASTVAKHEARLNSQVQTVMHLINFVKLNNTDQQDAAVETADTKTIISKSASEAKHVRSLRDGSTIRGGETVYTNVGDYDKELEVDEALIRSPAYLAHYRALMQGKSSSSKTDSILPPSGHPDAGGSSNKYFTTVSERGARRSSNLKFLITSLTWPLSTESRWLLCQAAQTGNIKWIETLLEKGAYINGWKIMDASNDSDSSKPEKNRQITPLMLAAMGKRHEAFHCLLNRGADLRAKDTEGCGVWNYVAAHDPDFIIHLIRSDIHPPPDLLPSLLCQAVDAERVDLLELLLTHATTSHLTYESIDPTSFNSKTVHGSILFRTIEKGNLEMVKLLGDKGADVNASRPLVVLNYPGFGFELYPRTSNSAPTLLFTVVQDVGRLDIAKYLVSKGANVNAKTDCRGCRTSWAHTYKFEDVTPLHVAPGACAEFLARKGANVSAVDNKGRTPLFWALDYNRLEPDLETVLANIAHGSPADLEDYRGIRPLFAVAEKLLASAWVSEKTLDIFFDTIEALRDAGTQPLDAKAQSPDRVLLQMLEKVSEKVNTYKIVGWMLDERYESPNNAIHALFIAESGWE